MDSQTVSHRFTSRLFRWLSLAMASTAVTIAIEIWPELAPIRWVAAVIGTLMVTFVIGSFWALKAQVRWRNYTHAGELIETAIEFLFIIVAVIVGAWVA